MLLNNEVGLLDILEIRFMVRKLCFANLIAININEASSPTRTSSGEPNIYRAGIQVKRWFFRRSVNATYFDPDHDFLSVW